MAVLSPTRGDVATRRTPGDARVPRPGRRFGARMQRPGLWFVLPAAALLVVFFAYPLAVSLMQSFFRTEGGVSTFVGIDQYTRMLRDPLVAKSLGNALLILVVQVPLMIALAVGLDTCSISRGCASAPAFGSSPSCPRSPRSSHTRWCSG